MRILTTTKPSDPDDTMSNMIKTFGKSMKKPLTYLFNKSLELGHVPYHWKLLIYLQLSKEKALSMKLLIYIPNSITSCPGKKC